jgi:hypothetical protein
MKNLRFTRAAKNLIKPIRLRFRIRSCESERIARAAHRALDVADLALRVGYRGGGLSDALRDLVATQKASVTSYDEMFTSNRSVIQFNPTSNFRLFPSKNPVFLLP